MQAFTHYNNILINLDISLSSNELNLFIYLDFLNRYEALKRHSLGMKGFSSDEAVQMLEHHGPSSIQKPHNPSLMLILLRQYAVIYIIIKIIYKNLKKYLLFFQKILYA